MNYGSIKVCDCANGPGMRTSIFVSGCSHHCPGCFNEITWDYNYGREFTDFAFYQVIDSLRPSQIQGLSILGGEPLDIRNQADVKYLIEGVRYYYQNTKDIWVYTGYVWETIPRFEDTDEMLGLVDIIVDGPFIESEKDITLKFRGSRNQRIIDCRKTLKERKVIEVKL